MGGRGCRDALGHGRRAVAGEPPGPPGHARRHTHPQEPADSHARTRRPTLVAGLVTGPAPSRIRDGSAGRSGLARRLVPAGQPRETAAPLRGHYIDVLCVGMSRRPRRVLLDARGASLLAV